MQRKIIVDLKIIFARRIINNSLDVFHVIRADILLVARIFSRPEAGLKKIRSQLVKYPPVLHEKTSNKI